MIRPGCPKVVIDVTPKPFKNEFNGETGDSDSDDCQSGSEDSADENSSQESASEIVSQNLGNFLEINSVVHAEIIKELWKKGGYTHILFLGLLGSDSENRTRGGNVFIRKYFDRVGITGGIGGTQGVYLKPSMLRDSREEKPETSEVNRWDITLEQDESTKFIESKRVYQNFQRVEKAVQMISDQSLKMSMQTSRKNLKIFLVCGEKNQGKTTLSQMIANNILLGIKRQPTKPGLPTAKVFFLETDLGQPVFSLPGFITMLQMDQNLLSNCTNTVL